MNTWYELTQALDTETAPLDDLAMQRILRRAMPKKRPWKLAAVLAAALLLTACGYAATHFTDWFPQLVKPQTDSEALLASMGTAIGETQTAGGYTVTLQGSVYDGSDLFLSVKIEGLKQADPYRFNADGGQSWLFPAKSENVPWDELPAGTYEALAASYTLQTLQCNSSETAATLLIESPVPASEEMVLHLENVKIGDETIVGPFEFRFATEKKDVSLVYPMAHTMTADGIPYTITQVRLTPLKVEITCEGQGTAHTPTIDELRCANGETPWFSGSGSRTETEEDGSWKAEVHMGSAGQVYDPAAVEAICIDGEWITLK